MPSRTLGDLIFLVRHKIEDLDATRFDDERIVATLLEAAVEVWKDLETVPDADYFNTSSTLALTSNTREYNLPANFSQLKYIEPPSTHTYLRFVHRDLSHPEFQQQRRWATSVSGQSYTGGEIAFDVYREGATSKLMLDVYPPAITVTIWYVKIFTDVTSLSAVMELPDMAQTNVASLAAAMLTNRTPEALLAESEEKRRRTIEAARPVVTSDERVYGYLE